MVFNIMSRNHDDHTKNFSFLMDKKKETGALRRHMIYVILILQEVNEQITISSHLMVSKTVLLMRILF